MKRQSLVLVFDRFLFGSLVFEDEIDMGRRNVLLDLVVSVGASGNRHLSKCV